MLYSTVFFSCLVLWTITLGTACGNEEIRKDLELTADETCFPDYGTSDESRSACLAFIEELKNRSTLHKADALYGVALAYQYLAMDTSDVEEKRRYRKQQNLAFEGLLKLEPDDIKVLYKYALFQDDDLKTVVLLKDVIKLEPNHFEAHWISGLFLFDQPGESQKKTARDHFLKAYANTSKSTGWRLKMAAELYGNLNRYGFDKDAAEILDRVDSDFNISQNLKSLESLARDGNPVDALEVSAHLVASACNQEYLWIKTDACESTVSLLQSLKKNNLIKEELYEQLASAAGNLMISSHGRSEPWFSIVTDAYEQLLATAPTRRRWLDYSRFVTGENRVKALQIVLEQDSEPSGEVVTVLADNLIVLGKEDEGVSLLRDQFDKASGTDLQEIGNYLATHLESRQMANEASKIRDQIQMRLNESR